MSMSAGQFDVVWPRSRQQVPPGAFASRLDSLEDATVAQLWDFAFRGDEIFTALEEGLKARYPRIRFVSWREFGNTHGSDEHAILDSLPERLRALGVDAVISGIAA